MGSSQPGPRPLRFGHGFPYAPLLAFLRTRLLGAVVMPALIGAGYTARHGRVPALTLALVLVGLAAAELLNLLGSDYVQWREQAPRARGSSRGGGPDSARARRAGRGSNTGPVILPGNPVIRPGRLDPRHIPAVALPLAAIGLGALIYFAVVVGPSVLLLFAAAAAIGGLYVLSPFPYAYLSTVVLPPLIAGGTGLALAGSPAVAGFAAGLPVAWISVAVILGYRVLYGADTSLDSRAGTRCRWHGVVLGFYVLAGANIAVWVTLRLLPPAGLLALVPWAVCLSWVAALLGQERSDPVPATAVGVLMHSATSAALALTLWLG
jgi:hypothetical protein